MTQIETDLEKFKKLFDSVGVVYDQYTAHNGYSILRHDGGYPGFYTEIEFTPDGEFSEMGAGE
jgi:hypothetical protein